jgi:hypothetical protein
MVVSGGSIDICTVMAEPEKIVWEVGLGGSLVQKPQSPDDDREAVETILVLCQIPLVEIRLSSRYGDPIDEYQEFAKIQRNKGRRVKRKLGFACSIILSIAQASKRRAYIYIV